MIKKLPLRKFVISDNAFVCSENLLTPFSGLDEDEPAKDAFNFYLSQLRICIEQTFGMMTTKWRILCRPLQVHLKHVGKIFMYLTWLHNFCIDEGCVCIINSEDNLQNETGFIPSDITETSITGNAVL